MRVWFITGCSRGIGRALAAAALARGHRVIATARERAQLDDLTAAHPGTCRTLTLDVTDAAQVKTAVAQAAEFFGRLDVIVNNAGCGLLGAVEELGDDEIARTFDVNCFGPLRVLRAALPLLRAQCSGHFVNISAAAAISNYAGFSIYGAAKCALEGFSEALSAEVKPLGIRVTIVQPGPFRTDFIAHSLHRTANKIGDYDGTVGRFSRMLDAMNGRQPGDPVRAAEAIIAAVESDSPPLRLVLGKYAHDKVRRRNTASANEISAWEQTGLTVDFSTSAP